MATPHLNEFPVSLSLSFNGSFMFTMFCVGEKGLYALAPPHQGFDGEWSDRSGVIVYKWNDKNNRPDTEVSIGRKDGAAVPSMMKMLHLIDGGGMFHMTMVSLCINPKIVLLAKFRSISNS